MGVYIPHMEIPRGRCEAIIFVHKDGSAYIAVSPEEGEVGYFREYPLVHVPEHGDLISMDALRHWILTEMASLDTEEDRKFVANRLANELPIIIPAEKGQTKGEADNV